MTDSLRRYVEKIEEGKPFDFRRFVKYLNQNRLIPIGSTQGDFFDTEKQGKHWLVTRADPEMMSRIKAYCSPENASKPELAKQNNAHAAKPTCSMIIRRTGNGFPDVVMIDNEGLFDSSQSNKKVLIVENKENFFYFEKSILFFRNHCELTIDETWDVLYGSGTESTCHLNQRFLSHYDEVIFYLDLDLGGLTIAKSIAKLTPEVKHQFLLPDDIEERLEKVVASISDKQWDDVWVKVKGIDFLYPTAKVIQTHQKFLEQESYLA